METERSMATYTREEYYERRQKIIEKFRPQFIDNQYNHSALLHNVIESLARGADPYEIIEQLINIDVETSERIQKLIMHQPPQPVVVCNVCGERFKDQIKQQNKNSFFKWPTIKKYFKKLMKR